MCVQVEGEGVRTHTHAHAHTHTYIHTHTLTHTHTATEDMVELAERIIGKTSAAKVIFTDRFYSPSMCARRHC